MTILVHRYDHNWERNLEFEEKSADLELWQVDKEFAMQLGIKCKEVNGKTIHEVDVSNMTPDQVATMLSKYLKRTESTGPK